LASLRRGLPSASSFDLYGKEKAGRSEAWHLNGEKREIGGSGGFDKLII